MKKYCKWILLIIILVAIVLLIISAILNKTTDNNVLNVQNTVVDMNETFKFKIFEYVVPDGLKFVDYKTKRFKIEGDGWYAIVGMFYNNNNEIYDNIEKFQSLIVKYGHDYNTTVGDVLTVNETKVITFKVGEGNGLLCYFDSNFGFAYEVKIFNNDGSYKPDALDKIMEPLMNVTYDENDSCDCYVGYLVFDDDKNKSSTN